MDAKPIVLVSHNLHAHEGAHGKAKKRRLEHCKNITKQLQLGVPGDNNRARKSMTSYKPEELDTKVWSSSL
jgi:hypothetical protein